MLRAFGSMAELFSYFPCASLRFAVTNEAAVVCLYSNEGVFSCILHHTQSEYSHKFKEGQPWKVSDIIFSK